MTSETDPGVFLGRHFLEVELKGEGHPKKRWRYPKAEAWD